MQKTNLRRSRALRLLPFLAAAWALPQLVGCEEKPAPPAALIEPPRPEAEVKFERIYEDINRSVGTEDAFQDRDTGMSGGANTQWTHRVDRKLIPPSDDSDTYEGVISITRRYTVTMYSFNKDDKDDEPEKKSKKTDESDPLAEFSDGSDPQYSFDAPTTERTLPGAGGSPIKTREGEEVKEFRLAYIDGSWRLLTAPDPETENSIKLAFEYALRRQ